MVSTSESSSLKTLLLHAPGDSPCDSPWMGVPALVAHLKQVGYPETHQRDLDLELYYYSQEPEAHRRIAELLKESARTMPKTGKLWKRVFLRTLGLPALKLLTRWELRDLKFFREFREATPVDQQFSEDGVIRYRRTLNRILKLMAIFYYPYLAYPKFFSKREKKIFYKVHLFLGCLFHDHLRLGRKAMEAFYEATLIPQIKEGGYDVVGVSVSVQRQYDTAIIVSDVIRKHGLDVKLVMGGSYISETYDAGWLEDEVVGSFDYVIRYEGEDAMHKLLLHLEGKCPEADIPNAIYMRDGKQVEHGRDRVRDIDVFAAPDYDDLPLDRYLDRPLRLPLLGNRGCYWAKCTFCAHFWSLGVGAMRDRSAAKLIEDLKELQGKYGVRNFFFADESMYPPTLDGLCDGIHEAGLDVNWAGMIRFEDCLTREYLQMMKSAGCYMLMFGLETISQRMQDVIKKGTHVPTVWRILRDCKAVGIKVHLFIILGIPGESEEDMQENLNFLFDNTDLYDTVQLATFELTMGSPISMKPERYGIANVEVHSPHARMAYSDVEFERTEGLSNEEVTRYVELAENHEVLFMKDYWGGYGFRIYQPDGVHVDASIRPKNVPKVEARSLTG